ncbi:MAG: amidohydrolase [Chitinophagaceae bacterium]|nr:amidohydrolase [Chitinophagaceae bacterium]
MNFYRRPLTFLFLFSHSLLLISLPSCKSKQQVSLIVHNAVIYSADKNFSIQQAMAIKNGKIIAIGANDDILRLYQSGDIIDAARKFIYPGFIDAHCHFTGYATDMWKCDVAGTASFDKVIKALIKYAATAKTEWLYARGWDQNDWLIKEFPDKKKIDSLFPDKPVFLKRIDGHAALVNQKALDMAGITVASKIVGGLVELKDGLLTGILFDNAMDVVENKIPLLPDVLAQQFFLQAQDSCFQYGLTGVHDCGINEHTVELVDAAQKRGDLKMKIFALLSDSAEYYNRWIKKGVYKTDHLHIGGFKLYADGALGSRGACLLQPYLDKPGWNGFLLNNPAHFRKIAQQLANTNFQLCTHAIGDSGNRVILDIYKEVLKGKNDKRWRVEHAQVVDENDFMLFGQYNIIPSVQPLHATSDMYWAADRLGPVRIKTAYAYKQLLEQNGWMPLGTDFPVEDINPFKTFYAAVARMDGKGFPAGGFQMRNGLSRKEVLCGMTIWAAKAAFEENEKGSLEAGKAADFFILEEDILACEMAKILNTRVYATFVNGKKVFTR